MENRQRVDVKNPDIIITDYDAELTEQMRIELVKKKAQRFPDEPVVNQETNRTNDISNGLQSSTNAYALNESEEEDRDIIESLTNAHTTICKKQVDDIIDVVESMEEEFAKSTSASRRSPEVKQISPSGYNIDDDMADKEVCRITRLFESENNFIPVSRSVKKSQRPTSSFVQPPPLVLANVSNMSVPKRVPSKKDPIVPERNPSDIFMPHFQPLREMSFSASAQSHTSCTIGTETLPVNGNSKFSTNILLGGSGSDSSPDPPNHWKLYSSNSPDSSDSQEEIAEIRATYELVENYENNAVSLSKDLPKSLTDQQ